MSDDATFNEVIHAPLRLRICGLLRAADGVDFAIVRDTLSVSDAVLSKHVKVLTDSGFVTMRKGASDSRTDSRRITWLSLTSDGREAFDSHVRALRQIAGAP